MIYNGVLDNTKDGIDHINVYSKGNTLIGRLLSNFYPSAFVHDRYGFFASVEAFWYWLSTGKKHDHLRYLWGFEAKDNGRKFDQVHCDEFRIEIEKAIRFKIEQNKVIMKELKESTLPLAHYYVFGNDSKRIMPLPKYDWLIEIIDNVRNELQGLN